MLEKARKEQILREKLLRHKKQKLAEFETEFYNELSRPKKVDNDMETRNYHLVDGYQSVNPDAEAEADQLPQK